MASNRRCKSYKPRNNSTKLHIVTRVQARLQIVTFALFFLHLLGKCFNTGHASENCMRHRHVPIKEVRSILFQFGVEKTLLQFFKIVMPSKDRIGLLGS